MNSSCKNYVSSEIVRNKMVLESSPLVQVLEEYLVILLLTLDLQDFEGGVKFLKLFQILVIDFVR